MRFISLQGLVCYLQGRRCITVNVNGQVKRRITDNLPLVAVFPWKAPRGKKYPFLVLVKAQRRDPHDTPDVPNTQYAYFVTRYMDIPSV